MKELICIVCPRGCHLTIDENKNVTGNSCPRGVQYAINEVTNPMRMLTSTVFISTTIIFFPRSSKPPSAKILILSRIKIFPFVHNKTPSVIIIIRFIT